jgi:pyruvate dehydrogenase E2 component (dihydrolipoamide acetyltransferase)
MEKKVDKRGRAIKKEIPYTGIRKVIGERMLQSINASPHGTAMSRFDMSKVVQLKEEMSTGGTPVTYTDIMIKIVAAAIREVPEINSALENDIITVYDSINVGVAVKVEDILVVPVVNDVECKSLLEIAKDTRDAIDLARNRQFDKIYMDGATITVNNLGMFNIEGCGPTLNFPETCLLAIGKISKEAWVDENDSIVVRPISTITCLINHAVLDGGQVGYFLTVMKKIIESPKDYID